MQRLWMGSRQTGLLIAACGWAVWLAAPSLASDDPVVAAETYQVGVAKIEITPEEPIRLSGFGFRREPSAGVESPLYARALAVSTAAGRPAVLVTVDSTGISQVIVEAVARELQADGIAREQLTITATHSHTAPMLDGVLQTLFGLPVPPDQQQVIARYTQSLTERLVEVCRAALADRQPAELWWGVGQLDFAINRRNPQAGPVDHHLPVLAIKTPAGELRGVLTTYACHAVTLSHNFVGGDWPGKAAEGIERRHPGTVAMISIGCGADQNPASGVTGDQIEVAVKQGLQLADEVDRVLQNALRPVSGEVTGQLQRFSLPLAPLPERAHWETLAQQDGYIGYHARVQLAALDRGESLPEAIDYSVQTLTFGDSLAMVFLPGEVVVDYALRLRRELDPARLWITAYANDTPCYIPSERVLKEGGYEGGAAMTYYNLPAPLAPGLEDKIIDAVTTQLLPRFASPHPLSDQTAAPALSPTQSLSRLQIPEGWRAQVVAAEPLTTDPVAFDFAADGSLWVCEMHDYPSGLGGNFEPGGKIRLLRDRDGDGIYDHSTVFLDKLPFPTGVMVWRQGVLICAAPNILYAEDTDGDGRADSQRVLFSGFGTENYQARVNSLTPGLDGWVYGSCGLFGGEITCHQTGETVALGNRDFRIDPDRGILEPLTGRSQQGRVRNDAGDWFGCTNGEACLQYPILQGATRPGLSLPPSVYAVADDDPAQLFPRAVGFQLFELSGPAGRVTAACGIGIYRDDWLGHEMSGSAVVCEPVNLLLHRRILRRDGLRYVGLRAAEEATSELITSTDNWFRPAQVRTGPDGGLWIADMSRSVIEHPRWIPEQTLATLDVRAGDQQGRIIRLLPNDKGARPVPNLASQTPAQRVAALRSPNGTVRDQAQQLLFWNPDPATVAPLRELVHSDALAAGRVAALWVLAQAESLQVDDLRVALTASDPLLRRQAVRLLAQAGGEPAERLELLALLREEADLAVAAEIADTLGSLHSPAGLPMLTALYLRHGQDPYVRFFVLRAVPSAAWGDFVGQVAEHTGRGQPAFQPLLSISLAERNGSAVQTLLEKIAGEPVDVVSMQLAEPIAQAFSRGRSTTRWWSDAAETTIARLQQQARATFAAADTPLEHRLAAAGLLGWDATQQAADFELLATALDPQSPPALQQRVIAVLARTAQPEVSKLFLSRLDQLGAAASTQIVTWLMSRPETVQSLLTAIEQQDVPLATLSATDRQTLLSFPDEELRARATRLLSRPSDQARGEVVERYRQVLQMSGDRERGYQVYQTHCRTCHRQGEEGFEVGPALSESRNKPWAALLEAVFDPNQAVDGRYSVYTVSTLDGRVIQGLLSEESEASITLKGPDAQATVIARSEIELFKHSPRSLMPDGLEELVSPQDAADLFAFVTDRPTAPERDAEQLAAQVDPLAQRAAQVLDDQQPVAAREQMIAASLDQATGLLQALVRDLPADDLDEEYRRIPWIWRVSIAAARKNDREQLTAMLRVSLPEIGKPLRDWQAVVLGGGLINGLSQIGVWPHERIATLIGNDGQLRQRWLQALQQSVTMTDNTQVKSGTRYDALRMIAMRGWNDSGAQLIRYLQQNDNAELQMGAVSGLVDVPDPPATSALIAALPNLTAGNRQLAIAGLLRSQDRRRGLLESVLAGQTPAELIDSDSRTALQQSESAELQELARRAFAAD